MEDIEINKIKEVISEKRKWFEERFSTKPEQFSFTIGFVGTRAEWDVFCKRIIHKYEYCTFYRKRFELSIKENGVVRHYTWIPYQEQGRDVLFYNRHSWGRIILPKRASPDYFWGKVYPYIMHYCFDIDFYERIDEYVE